MAYEEVRLPMPETDPETGHPGFRDAIKTVIDQEDGALWCTFKCKGIRQVTMRKGGTSPVQEFTFGFAGKDENRDFFKRQDDPSRSDWYEIKVSLWGSKGTRPIVDGSYVDDEGNPLEWADWATGDRLAALYGIGNPKKGISCRIIFNPEKCYGQPGKDNWTWYKYDDPDEGDIFLSRPPRGKCSEEQNRLWDEIEETCQQQYGIKSTWIKLFTAQAANPFSKQEQEEEEPEQEQEPVAVDEDAYDGSLL